MNFTILNLQKLLKVPKPWPQPCRPWENLSLPKKGLFVRALLSLNFLYDVINFSSFQIGELDFVLETDLDSSLAHFKAFIFFPFQKSIQRKSHFEIQIFILRNSRSNFGVLQLFYEKLEMENIWNTTLLLQVDIPYNFNCFKLLYSLRVRMPCWLFFNLR